MNFSKTLEEDPLHTLKEMQPRLQLTEEQFNIWTGKDSMNPPVITVTHSPAVSKGQQR